MSVNCFIDLNLNKCKCQATSICTLNTELLLLCSLLLLWTCFANVHYTVDKTLQLSSTANKRELICISFIPFLRVEFCFFFPSYEFSLFNLHYRLNPSSLRHTLEVQKSPPSCLHTMMDGRIPCVWARGAWLKSHLSDPRWAYGLNMPTDCLAIPPPFIIESCNVYQVLIN